MDLLCKSPYSVRMRENKDQKSSYFRILLEQLIVELLMMTSSISFEFMFSDHIYTLANGSIKVSDDLRNYE